MSANGSALPGRLSVVVATLQSRLEVDLAVEALRSEGIECVVVLDFHASWCPTCRKQEAVIADLAKEPAMKNVAVFKVDFDNARRLKKAHEVSRQSTLVVLKEGKEVARATGLTSKDSIRELIGRAL